MHKLHEIAIAVDEACRRWDHDRPDQPILTVHAGVMDNNVGSLVTIHGRLDSVQYTVLLTDK
jgi:hypothetical protein